MTECRNMEVQELLPDVLHDSLPAESRAMVEAHLAACGEGREELEVLREVKQAAIFAPAIDANRISQQIPPYRTIVPVAERPKRPKFVSWLVAGCLALVVAAGGSLLVPQRGVDDAARVATTTREAAVATQTQVASDAAGVTQRAQSPSDAGEIAVNDAVPPSTHVHALAMAVGVEDLSDGDIKLLMNDMDQFDALPTAEPDPVIAVDNGESLDEGTR
jgi:hypothetical protein